MEPVGAVGIRLTRMAEFPFIRSRERGEIAWLQTSLSSLPVNCQDNCWDHISMSMSNPNQLTRMSKVFVMGSILPTLSKTMFTVEMKIFHTQEKK